MTLQPLLTAPLLIQIHALGAIAAFVVGVSQLALPKGTVRHRAVGWIWVAGLAAVAATSFGIRVLNAGSFSFVHAISLVTLVMLPLGILHARRGRIRQHAIAMVALFVGALVIAGAFTLLPSRIMGRVVFGATTLFVPRAHSASVFS